MVLGDISPWYNTVISCYTPRLHWKAHPVTDVPMLQQILLHTLMYGMCIRGVHIITLKYKSTFTYFLTDYVHAETMGSVILLSQELC